MFVKVDLIFFFAIVFVQGRSINDWSKKESFDNLCNFDTSRKLYDSIDLFRCINQLASTSDIREIDRSRKDEYFDWTYSKNSLWTNLIASFVNGESNSDYQIPQLLNTGSNQYQSNQDETAVGGGLFDSSSGGLNINLFDALYLISRYDDYKCIPRILCEVASGITPGESIYGRDANLFNNLFEKNILSKLLTNFNIAESSPLLSFGKAALLGYTSKNNPRNCYQEYPKCPRNSDQLIHYLNNYNGGFFRYFNKFNHGYNLYNRPYIAQRNKGYFHRNRLQSKRNQAPSPGFGKISSDRSGTGELKFDADTDNDTLYYETRIRNQINRVIFPDDEKSTKFVDTSNRLPKTLFDLEAINDTDDVQQNGSNFFPRQQTREEKYEESNQLYNSFQQSSESSLKTVVFPDD